MSVENITASMQNYLKVIWGLEEWSETPVTNSAIAESAGVRLSTVSDALRKLADHELIDHARYGAVTLTPEGRELAVLMTRRHRLIETFLVRMLDYAWDEVHDEADRLEHAVSDELIDRIDRVLEYPTRDPHGDPIPSADGRVHRPEAVLLSEAPVPCRARVERISDSDAAMLQFFASRGIIVDVDLEVLPGDVYSETTSIVVAGGEPIHLGQVAASSVWVSISAADAADSADVSGAADTSE